MKTHIRKIMLVLAVAVAGSFIIMPQTAQAATPITIDGTVYDKGAQPLQGVTVVAWCGGVNFFGGSGKTDSAGYYLIHTESDGCPLGTELTVTTDIDNDGLSDGARHSQTHSQSTVNIYLGKYGSIAVPEYGWIGGGAAGLAGLGAIGFARRRAGQNQR